MSLDNISTADLLREIAERLRILSAVPGPMPLTVIKAMRKVDEVRCLVAVLDEPPPLKGA